jgi:hypothetical protein
VSGRALSFFFVFFCPSIHPFVPRNLLVLISAEWYYSRVRTHPWVPPAHASPGGRCPRRSPVALFAHTRESESKSGFREIPPGCLREMNDSEVGRSARAPGRVPRVRSTGGGSTREGGRRERESALSRRSRASDARVN